MNQNQSGLGLIQTEISIRINSHTDSFNLKINPSLNWFWLIRIENLLRIHSDRNLRLNPINFQAFFNKRDSRRFSDWFGLKIYFGFVRMNSDRSLGLSQINFQAFFNKRDSKRFSDWFVLIRTDSDTRCNFTNIFAENPKL